MFGRSQFARIAALAAIAVAGRAWAADSQVNSQSADAQATGLTLSPTYADDSAGTTPAKPLTALLDKAGMGDALSAANITVGGYVEGGWTYNLSNSGTRFNTGRVFDFENQDLTLDQAEVFVQRAVDATKGKWDVGFMVDGMYGADARLIHSNGLDFYGPGDASNGGQAFPQNQFDLTQAYVTVAVPLGTGLTIEAGKFVTMMGYETINAINNPLYSHSYMFGYAIPFTQTGVLGKYNFTKDLSVTAGITRGWEQSTKDDNDSIDFAGQVAYTVNDKCTVTLSTTIGPERANNNSDYRDVFDLVVAYKLSDQLTLGANGDYGWEGHSSADGSDGQWSGIALYAAYTIDPRFTLNGRVEYFNDHDGARGLGAEAYEATVGVTCKPWPDNQWASGFEIRPEVRWDYSPTQIFEGGTNNDQVTFGVDAIYAF
jgi:Putative beta-barrel porin-2, OmpL-like. bbp2